jgi:hypothetical protein
LAKLAAGHYQAVLPVSAAADYRIELIEERRGRSIAYPSIGYSLPYDLGSEFPRPDYNLTLLNALAEATGGEINPRLLGPVENQSVTNSYQTLRQPLVILAAALFLLEIALRKLLFFET